nr:ABC transporter permease [uncultured Mucilaginibacter sp.]
MIKNYLKIALRTLWRDRAFSFINMAGLAVGLASVLMIMAYVRYELSYDTAYSNAPNVYRVSMVSPINGTERESIAVPYTLTKTLIKEFPAINAYSIVNKRDLQYKYKSGNVSLSAVWATVDFFKLFNLKLISGDPATALKEPNSVVVTEKMAKQYFKGANPVGKTIDVAYARVPYKITGVVSDLPSNMHFDGEVIVSLEGDRSLNDKLDLRGFTGIPQYISLNKNSDAKALESQFKSFYKKYHFEDVTLRLMPVQKIHLYSHVTGEFKPNSDIKYIYIFSSIAILILIIACINYINLTTARSIQRAREIGVRKVLGAVKKQLVAQFLSESFLFFSTCLLLAIVLATACWPAFSQVVNPDGGRIPLFSNWSFILLPAVILIFGLLSGLYPAFILSKIKTAQVIKGVTAFGINVSFRKVLVAVQFVISGFLIISTIVIYQQLNFVSNKRLGFNKEHLIATPFYMFKSHVGAFKNELKQSAGVKNVSVASWRVGEYFGSNATDRDENDSTKSIVVNFINADPDFIKTMGIDVINGRDFSRSNATDMQNLDSLTKGISYSDPKYKRLENSTSVIMNEEAFKTLNIKYKENMVVNMRILHGTVIGVVTDFNGLSLHEKVPAVVIKCEPHAEFGQMYIRIGPENVSQTLAFIQKKWNAFYPEEAFNFSFVDDNIQKLYTADQRVGHLFGTFAVLGILIACLGLFALISLTVQQKVKEIGIRKVLGAGVGSIVALLSTDFLKLVILSMLIASPVAWYAMHKWLQDFAYRIDVEWWVFAVAAAGALIIAFVTVSFQSVKAATANPVKSLRSE